jgi:hypothetical protein
VVALVLATAPVYKRDAIALVVFATAIAIAPATAAGLAAKLRLEFQMQEPAAKVVATPTLAHQ